jgi:tetratricopeptide (TPR) repeat protein
MLRSVLLAASLVAVTLAQGDLLRQGAALDLEGNHAEARKLFQEAIDSAPTPTAKAQAQRSMAISWAFDPDCDQAAKYEVPVHEYYLAQKDFYNAGEIANELARICIEANRLDDAQKWYLKGREVGLQEPNITPDRRDLWEFRTEHALARLAARRGNRAEAQKHIAAAKAILDKGTNPSQAQFFPYLTGYAAFYLGDYKEAISDLSQANQGDPFILSLLAQSYEKTGDKAQAESYYRKSLTVSNAHNPPNAFARPLARKKLGM